MRIKPISASANLRDRDERFNDEERRYRLLSQLMSEMDVPQDRHKDLMIPAKRKQVLQWLETNLAAYNSHHKNYQRVKNLIALSLKKLG